MADIKEILKKYAIQIRDEHQPGGNTATRVGSLLLAIIESSLGEELEGKFIRKDQPDFTNFLVKFLGGIESGTYKQGVSGAKIDKSGNAELGSLLTRLRAILAELQVNGNSEFRGNLSSQDFVSGFTSGKGWAIFIKEVINALGVTEHKSVMELDDLIVRGTLRVFEFVVSQMLGENDNRTFTAMMEVDHYDPVSGRVWLDTRDGKLYNPFRIGDYILVQQFNGMPSDANNHYLTKHYELIITGVGMGSLNEGEDRLDWVTFKNFTCTMDGGSIELITKGDTFVRVDNATDPDRKGIIQMMTVGNTTPYMDVIYGLKTDPDNALKSRFGNLQGIYHHLFGWLKEFGAYIINLYAVGEFRLRSTGEDLETKIDMLRNQFTTSYAKLKFEMSEDDNFLRNATFTESLDGWLSESDIRYLTDGVKPLYLNRSLYTVKHKVAGVEPYDGRNMLHIFASYVKQLNADIRKPGTHKVFKPSGDALTESYVEVPDTLYMAIKFVCRLKGVLTIGFQGASVGAGSLPLISMTVNESYEYQSLEWSGTWDGLGDFLLRFTGDIYISHLSVSTHPLDDYKVELSTRFEQSAERIALLGTRIDQVKDTVTDLGIEISAERERITLWATKTDNLHVTVTDLGVQLNAAKGSINLWATKTDTLNKTVTQLGIDLDTAERAISLHSSYLSDAQTDLAALQVKANEISASVTSVSGRVTTAQSTAEYAQRIAESAKSIADSAGDAEVYNQSSNPWNSWSGGSEYKHVGALWYDTSTGTRKRYIGYDNSNSWEDVTASIASSSYIQQHGDKISMVVASFDSNGKPTSSSGILTTAYASSLYATKTTVDTLSGRVSSQSAQLDVHSSQISMRVEKNGIISSINQSAESIKIKAKLIDINGATFDQYGFMTVVGATIGGFEIQESSISSKPNAYSGGSGANYYASSRFFLHSAGSTSAFMGFSSQYKWAGIGLNCFPELSGLQAMGRFVDTDTSSFSYSKAGLYIAVSGARTYDDRNYHGNSALYIAKGHITGFRRRLRRMSYSQTLTVMDSIIVCTNTGDINVTMPSDAEDGQEIWMIAVNRKRVNVSAASGDTIIAGGGSFTTDRWHVYIYDAHNRLWLYSYMNYN